MIIRIFFPAVVLLIVVSLIITTLSYPPKAKLFPLVVALPVAILLLLDIIREVQTILQGKTGTGYQAVTFKGILRQHFSMAVWLVVFALVIYILGILVGALLYLLIYLKLHGEKWLTAIIYVFAIIIFIYGVFETALDIPMYKGILFEQLK